MNVDLELCVCTFRFIDAVRLQMASLVRCLASLGRCCALHASSVRVLDMTGAHVSHITHTRSSTTRVAASEGHVSVLFFSAWCH